MLRIAREYVKELDEEDQNPTVSSILRAMRRFFWFTVEFGLMSTAQGVKAYGSGLLSSYGEMKHAITSDQVQDPLQLEWVINQGYEIYHYQQVLFMISLSISSLGWSASFKTGCSRGS